MKPSNLTTNECINRCVLFKKKKLLAKNSSNRRCD